MVVTHTEFLSGAIFERHLIVDDELLTVIRLQCGQFYIILVHVLLSFYDGESDSPQVIYVDTLTANQFLRVRRLAVPCFRDVSVYLSQN